MSGTGNKFFAVRQTPVRTYAKTTFANGLAAAKAANVRFNVIGTSVDCTSISVLSSLYSYFDNDPSWYADVNTESPRFRDLGNRAYFRANGFIVQIWALVAYVNGATTEGSGPAPVWIPIYLSYDKPNSSPPNSTYTFDDPKVTSVSF